MKRNIIILVLLAVGIIATSASLLSSDDNAEEKRFQVYIEQDGKRQEANAHTVLLKPKPFDIILELSAPMGVLVSASFDEKTFQLASQNEHLDKLPGFEGTGMAEGLRNDKKEILLSDVAPNYWFYDNESENRFNEVKVSDSGIVGVRTIENIHDTDSKKRIGMTKMKKPLYLVFISYKRGREITDQIELQREYVMIEWAK